MGKQIDGAYVEWPETAEVASRVQDRAVEELLDLWEHGKTKTGFPPLWGDEVEYAIVRLDCAEKRAGLSSEQAAVLRRLKAASESGSSKESDHRCLDDLKRGKHAGYTPEFARYMVESEPEKPYGISARSLLSVERSMAERRIAIRRQLDINEYPFTLSIFPRLGADGTGEIALEALTNNSLISPEGRYQAAGINVKARRGTESNNVSVPLFQDAYSSRFPEALSPSTDPEQRRVALDSMVFGPGHCGFQVTFQGSDEKEARILHDQLVPLGPIMLALTAATPIYKGFLVDTDARWNQISQVVDDRSQHERQQSRGQRHPSWFACQTYIAQDERLSPSYQRADLPIHETAKARLEAAGMDTLLARHYSHILVRDPVIISRNTAESALSDNPQIATHEHFESLEGTVWPHVRFKLPPIDNAGIGWRVEFRSMETQFTDFENAAFAIFMILLRLAIPRYNLNMYAPIDKVQENMDRAHARDAVNQQTFWWRLDDPNGTTASTDQDAPPVELSLDAIVNGSPQNTGLLPLAEQHLHSAAFTPADRARIAPYLELVRRRASGEFWTAARWMRETVRAHPSYAGDGVVSEHVCFELMERVVRMVEGDRAERMFTAGVGEGVAEGERAPPPEARL
ncbi:uncharacterized protein K452DRAFT_279650 [Aplosporella prunicola CBS 121167]|uniref:Glutamate--cysteine ligase n=1 Tax=Aplosporella prunicola CBS 121167 TaxID=1176127 RepID=A0A6A6B0D9_9PEZI|nr:uncharacterized protein K452DRAFT_279650 [Aplosporella prunicola CBS 121167]KAF2136695.1 hypothetical protein K452DRAFT_279650 [Aplosporella prunicola CBS 121167]